MKKNWTNATIEELNISATEMTNSAGTEVDGGTWNNTTGVVTYTYYPSGEHAQNPVDGFPH